MTDTEMVFVAIAAACLYRVIKAESWRETFWMTVAGLASAGMALATWAGVK